MEQHQHGIGRHSTDQHGVDQHRIDQHRIDQHRIDQHGTDQHRAEAINFYTRKWVRPEDLNANGSLFGGSLLRWIDEEAAIYAIIQLGNHRVVTKFISEIDFQASARQGDLIEMGLVATEFGRTSITMRAQVRNMITRRTILSIERIVFVNLGEDGAPAPHGYTSITYARDRMPLPGSNG